MVLGLSDHTPGHSTVLGAIALGARLIEKHFTDDTTRDGPDHAFSMNPKSWSEMVDRSRELESSLGNGIKKVEENEKETVVLQRRCLRVVRDIEDGEILNEKDISILRPCPEGAMTPDLIEKVIGKRLVRKVAQGDHLELSDIK